MIHLNHINKFYPTKTGLVQALRDVHLKVAPGAIQGIIGKSGAGKSSLLRCVNLLERPCSGDVIVDGMALLPLKQSALRAARKKMGMIFQQFNLLNSKTVFENIALPLSFSAQKNNPAIEQQVFTLLDLVGLKDHSQNYPMQLSGGQKQRVAIARALITQPKILLCDEATSSLDPQTTTALLSLLKDIHKEFSITILLITHEMEVIKQICERVSIMDKGEIIEEGEVARIFSNPKTALSKELVYSLGTQKLPEYLKNKLQATPFFSCHPILKIIFHNDSSASPVISSLIQAFNLTINIHAANIEYIVERPLGIMIIELVDKQADILERVIGFLQEKQISVEVLGYVE